MHAPNSSNSVGERPPPPRARLDWFRDQIAGAPDGYPEHALDELKAKFRGYARLSVNAFSHEWRGLLNHPRIERRNGAVFWRSDKR